MGDYAAECPSRPTGSGCRSGARCTAGSSAASWPKRKAGRPHNPRVSARQLDRLRRQLTEYEKLCAEVSQPPAQVALAWLLQRPGVTSTVVGPNTTEQLDGTAAALDLHLHDQALTRLDEIFPGYRTSPEDYAW